MNLDPDFQDLDPNFVPIQTQEKSPIRIRTKGPGKLFRPNVMLTMNKPLIKKSQICFAHRHNLERRTLEVLPVIQRLNYFFSAPTPSYEPGPAGPLDHHTSFLPTYSEYGSGPTKLLNTEPIWIRIHKTKFLPGYRLPQSSMMQIADLTGTVPTGTDSTKDLGSRKGRTIWVSMN